jgi:Uma2 family endonuclease
MLPKIEKKYYTFEEYVAFEKEIQIRHQFYHGEIFAMAGGTKRHNTLVGNVKRFLEDAIEGKACKVYAENVKLELEKNNHYVYPDVMLTCHHEDIANDVESIVFYPSLIVEVLSGSTKEYDSREKKSHYFRIKNLQYYLLVFQDEALVEVYERKEDFWKLQIFEGLEKEIFLEKLNIKLKIKDLYKGIAF